MSALFRTKRAGDFDGLYRRHAPTVYRYAYAVLGNQADAEDVTQQTFLNAYRATQRGTRPRKEENWLVTIAHNELRRHLRSNGKVVEVEFDDRIAHQAPEPGEARIADVVRALRKLPASQREALVLREFEGRPYAEIAEILGITKGALESLLFRARRALAEELHDGLTCEDAEQAISRRLDGRLRRREGRRLKEHLKDCAHCLRFASIQKRQRTALRGLSVMPIPASLFLVRGEQATAAFTAGAAATGSGLAGGGVAGGTALGGLGAGLVAKAAAVSAAAAMTGGVGYGLAVDRDAPAGDRAKAAQRAAAPAGESARPVALAPARIVAPGRKPAATAAPRKTVKGNRGKARGLGRIALPPPGTTRRQERAARRAAGLRKPPTAASRDRARPAQASAARKKATRLPRSAAPKRARAGGRQKPATAAVGRKPPRTAANGAKQEPKASPPPKEPPTTQKPPPPPKDPPARTGSARKHSLSRLPARRPTVR